MIAALNDRFGWPAVPMRALVNALATDTEHVGGERCLLEAICRSVLLKNKWLPRKDEHWVRGGVCLGARRGTADASTRAEGRLSPRPALSETERHP